MQQPSKQNTAVNIVQDFLTLTYEENSKSFSGKILLIKSLRLLHNKKVFYLH